VPRREHRSASDKRPSPLAGEGGPKGRMRGTTRRTAFGIRDGRHGRAFGSRRRPCFASPSSDAFGVCLPPRGGKTVFDPHQHVFDAAPQGEKDACHEPTLTLLSSCPPRPGDPHPPLRGRPPPGGEGTCGGKPDPRSVRSREENPGFLKSPSRSRGSCCWRRDLWQSGTQDQGTTRRKFPGRGGVERWPKAPASMVVVIPAERGASKSHIDFDEPSQDDSSQC